MRIAAGAISEADDDEDEGDVVSAADKEAEAAAAARMLTTAAPNVAQVNGATHPMSTGGYVAIAIAASALFVISGLFFYHRVFHKPGVKDGNDIEMAEAGFRAGG